MNQSKPKRSKPKRNIIIFLIAIILAVLIGLIIPLRQNIVFVLDNSGSMTRNLPEAKGETYTSLAKKNIEDSIKDDSKLFLTDIGLVTVGGQCKSYNPENPADNLGTTEKLHLDKLIEKRQDYAKVVSPLGDSKEQFLGKLHGIREDPTGSTPLGFGIRAAAESLPQFSLNSRIYVITDGNVQDGKFKESGTGNCGEDVCTVFKEFQNKFQNKNFNFGVTVVPFGADPNSPLFQEYKKCGLDLEEKCIPGVTCPIKFPPLLPILIIICLLPFAAILIIWILKVRKQKTVMFMLDVSGSMADLDHSEQVKIDAAREAFREIIRLISQSSPSEQSNQKVGFVAFGGQCGQLRGKPIDPAYDNLRIVEKALDNPVYYEPNGSTPLAYAIQEVTTILKKQRYLNWLKKFTPIIILITDGCDTCDGDPVREIKQAKEEGIDFIIIVIAYSVNGIESDINVLPKIADASNGYYLTANTREELQKEVREFDTIQKSKKGTIATGKIKILNDNKYRWELRLDTRSQEDDLSGKDSGEHEIRVGDYELRIILKDQTTKTQKVSIRKNKTKTIKI